MLSRFKAWFVRTMMRVGHKAEHAFHATYLLAVSIEGHGKYRYAALALLLVIALNATINSDE